jgi:uncharacterized membrane-anchored protein YjiN (DUF445 family)
MILKEDIDHIVENVFEENIKNEVFDVIDLVFKTNKHKNHFKFIQDSYARGDKNSLNQIHIRIDYIKSLFIKEGLMQNSRKDYFGKMEILNLDSSEL